MVKKYNTTSQAITLTEQYQIFKTTNTNQKIADLITLMESIEEKPNTPDLRHLEEVIEEVRPEILKLDTVDRELIERVINQKTYSISKDINKSLTKWDYFKETAEKKGWEPVQEVIRIIDENEERYARLNAGYNDLTDKDFEEESKRDKEDLNEIDRLMKEDISEWMKTNVSEFYSDLIRRSIKAKRTTLMNRLERSVDIRFSKWLKETRKSKNMTMADLYEKSGISASYIQRLEAGKRKMPTFNIIKSLASGLGVSFREVFSVIEESVENQTVEELITEQEFTLTDDYATSEQKDILINLIKLAIGENQTEKLDFNEITKVAEMVQKLRDTLK